MKCVFNPFTTEARFFVLNAMAFSTKKRASVVKGLNIVGIVPVH